MNTSSEIIRKIADILLEGEPQEAAQRNRHNLERALRASATQGDGSRLLAAAASLFGSAAVISFMLWRIESATWVILFAILGAIGSFAVSLRIVRNQQKAILEDMLAEAKGEKANDIRAKFKLALVP